MLGQLDQQLGRRRGQRDPSVPESGTSGTGRLRLGDVGIGPTCRQKKPSAFGE